MADAIMHAQWLESEASAGGSSWNARMLRAAGELRHQHAEIERLRAALAAQQAPAQAKPAAWMGKDGHPRHISYVWGALEKRLYGPPIPLYTAAPAAPAGWQPTEAQIVAAARALNKRHAELCNVNEADSWMIQGDDFREDARAALLAAAPTHTGDAPVTMTRG